MMYFVLHYLVPNFSIVGIYIDENCTSASIS